jgi:hypothetical protein
MASSRLRLQLPIRNAKGLRWPALILGAAVILYGAAFVVLRWYNWTPLTLPLDLKPGLIRSQEFRVDQKTRYLVELEVDRSIPFNQLNCLLGESIPPKPCSVKSVIDIEWTLLSGSKEVASGASRNERGGGYGPTITKTLGSFDAVPHTPYVLLITSLMDGSALAQANPRIVVEVHPTHYKGYFVIAQLMAMIAMGIAAIGFIWLLIWLVRAYLFPRKA